MVEGQSKGIFIRGPRQNKRSGFVGERRHSAVIDACRLRREERYRACVDDVPFDCLLKFQERRYIIMDGDSGALILLIVLVVSAFLLIVIKLAQFVNRFSREKQYLLNKMYRAADYNEYRYWHRELRCFYLCLIPFVTERNVMKVYPVFFHRAKHATKEKRSDGFMHILAPSMLAICICAICLCGASWAWFTASTSTGTTTIQSSSYKLLYQVGEDTASTELGEAGTAYTLTADTRVIKLKANGTPGAAGYCSIKIGDKIYYTEQIFVNDTSVFTFTVNAAAGTKIILTSKWGIYSGTATIQNGGEITATGSQPSSARTPDNAVADDFTVPTTPNGSPAENESATADATAAAPSAPTTPNGSPAENESATPDATAAAPSASTTPNGSPAESESATPDATAAATSASETTADTEPVVSACNKCLYPI